MKSIFCKDTPKALAEIRAEIAKGEPFEVNNQYETFYGVGFDRWLREGVADLKPEIKVTTMNRWEGYPWTYIITPAK